ncbi:MAG: hypothetical protein K2N78_03220 [Oscillospiraceae bacterium]|nr:hypothetical protein [Oscillospiraceae bacterium]
MEIKVEHTTETVGKKTYPLTITHQTGIQEIMVDGKPVKIEKLTIFESPLGTSRCWTRVTPAAPPDVRAENLRRIKETATKAMIDMGIW